MKSIDRYLKVLRSIEILQKYWNVMKSPRTQDFSNNEKETIRLKSPDTQDFLNNRSETSLLKSPRAQDFSNNWKETSMLKSPRTQDFSNNRKESSMLKSPRTQDSKTTNYSGWPDFVPQFCFPLISLVKSSLALCMFALQNQLYY